MYIRGEVAVFSIFHWKLFGLLTEAEAEMLLSLDFNSVVAIVPGWHSIAITKLIMLYRDSSSKPFFWHCKVFVPELISVAESSF
jgi:hypothetical protein